MRAFQGRGMTGQRCQGQEAKESCRATENGGTEWPVSAVYSYGDSREPLEALDWEGYIIGNRVYDDRVLCL